MTSYHQCLSGFILLWDELSHALPPIKLNIIAKKLLQPEVPLSTSSSSDVARLCACVSSEDRTGGRRRREQLADLTNALLLCISWSHKGPSSCRWHRAVPSQNTSASLPAVRSHAWGQKATISEINPSEQHHKFKHWLNEALKKRTLRQVYPRFLDSFTLCEAVQNQNRLFFKRKCQLNR